MIHVTWGVVIACGKEEQLPGGAEIAFLGMGSRPALVYSLLAFEGCPDIEGMAVVVSKERMEGLVSMVNVFGLGKVRKIVAGGSTRRTCLQSAMAILPEEVTLLAIHEASRPCVTPSTISESVKAAKRYGGALAALPIFDGMKETAKGGNRIVKTVETSGLWQAQSPATFRRDLLQKSLELAAKKKGWNGDEASTFELIKKPVHVVPDDSLNLRIRNPSDLTLATSILAMRGQLL